MFGSKSLVPGFFRFASHAVRLSWTDASSRPNGASAYKQSTLGTAEKKTRLPRRPKSSGLPALTRPGLLSAAPARGALRSGGLASAALLLRPQTHREPRP